jgi:hypothetical protein
MHRLALVLVALTLSACASKEQQNIGDIAATPLRDLNISKVEIPEMLQAASNNPYQTPASMSCPSLLEQVSALDELLGPDVDAPEEKLARDAMAREALGKAATGALQNTVEGAIPFRGWLRKLSGAERHSRHAQEAVLAGKVRRGFLKGIMQSQDCRRV